MKNRAKVLVPKMTEAEALDAALRLWGENAWVLAHSENNVCVSGGKGSRAYGEGESFEMAFVDADRRAYLWVRVKGENSVVGIADIAYVSSSPSRFQVSELDVSASWKMDTIQPLSTMNA